VKVLFYGFTVTDLKLFSSLSLRYLLVLCSDAGKVLKKDLAALR
jgi:hypothetical protein